MKKKPLSFALALVLSLGMFTAGALAASGTRTIEVTYRDINLVVDGVYSTSYDLKFDAAPKTLNIPISYAPNVRLLFTAPENESFSDGAYGIYDISFS